MKSPDLILVNEQDEAIGTMEKMEAHRKGLLHRAFSVFIINDAGDILLQRRALEKYHSPGLWTNACCSHPFPGEATVAAAHRRLQEELGFDCEMKEIFTFTYRAEFDNGLTEHEFDHVLLGTYNGNIYPNPSEVCEYQYLSSGQILALMEKEPATFTIWFHRALPQVLQYMNIPINAAGI
jgi:isopentenyl-diphosphate delta-isomerase